MKLLNTAEASARLASLGLEIGEWNEVRSYNKDQVEHWTKYQAPSASRHLLNFCYRISSWLPRSDWTLVQIDNSTFLDSSQKLVLGRILSGEHSDTFGDPGSYLLDNCEMNADDSYAILLAHATCLLLIFEAHCYIVASNGKHQQRLGIQDGFVYFLSTDSSLADAAQILEEYEKNPDGLPDWVVRFNASREMRDAVDER